MSQELTVLNQQFVEFKLQHEELEKKEQSTLIQYQNQIQNLKQELVSMNEKVEQEEAAHQKELLTLRKENKQVHLIKKAIADMCVIYEEAIKPRQPSPMYSIYLRE